MYAQIQPGKVHRAGQNRKRPARCVNSTCHDVPTPQLRFPRGPKLRTGVYIGRRPRQQRQLDVALHSALCFGRRLRPDQQY